jgi:hypothetical protein
MQAHALAKHRQGIEEGAHFVVPLAIGKVAEETALVDAYGKGLS